MIPITVPYSANIQYKMGEKYFIPEVNTNSEWLLLTGRKHLLSKEEEDGVKTKQLQAIKANQLLLIDVFTGWSGPCNAVEGHLRRMRHSNVEAPDCLALARQNYHFFVIIDTW